MQPPPPRSTLFPYTTLFRSHSRRTVQSVRHLVSDIGSWSDARRAATPVPSRTRASDRCMPAARPVGRSEEHTSELQSQSNLVCRLLLEKKNTVAEVSHYPDT